MEITVLDFFLINILSYIGGVATGLLVCCKHKDKLLVKSRSTDNISSIARQLQPQPYSPPPPTVVASAPPPDTKQPIKITLE
jgi:hypothetical protein